MACRGVRGKEIDIVVVGLDNAGKSAFINRLKPEEERLPDKHVLPTCGFRKEVVWWGEEGRNINIWDMSGQSRYRELWPSFYDIAVAVVWVVNLSDPKRICLVKEELDNLLIHPDMNDDKPMLFLGNQRDGSDLVAGDGLKAEKVWTALQLNEIARTRTVRKKTISALRGDGIPRKDPVDWLGSELFAETHPDSVRT